MDARGTVGTLACRGAVAACVLSAAVVSPVCVAAGDYLHPVVVTCLGDSVTYGAPWKAGDPETYPAQLAVLLDSAYPSKVCEVHNRGVNGATADTLLAKLNSEGFPEQPDFVLLMIGGNDLGAAHDSASFSEILPQTLSEVQQCVNRINDQTNHDGKKPRVLLSAFIPNRIGNVGGWDANLGIQIYNASLADMEGVDRYFSTNFSDLYSPTPPLTIADLICGDLVHPTEAGYTLIAENWYDEIAAFPPMVDTDGDGLWDEEETDCGTNLELADSDADGLGDLVELACADAAAALGGYAKRPAAVRVNFQPPRRVSPSGFAPDGGCSAAVGSPFWWD